MLRTSSFIFFSFFYGKGRTKQEREGINRTSWWGKWGPEKQCDCPITTTAQRNHLLTGCPDSPTRSPAAPGGQGCGLHATLWHPPRPSRCASTGRAEQPLPGPRGGHQAVELKSHRPPFTCKAPAERLRLLHRAREKRALVLCPHLYQEYPALHFKNNSQLWISGLLRVPFCSGSFMLFWIIACFTFLSL